VKPAAFEYHAIGTAEEARALLAIHRDEAKLLAGGQSLMAMMNLRLARPAHLVDLNRASELDYVRETPDGLAVGAMVRQRTIERSPIVARRVPLLVAALKHVAHFQIRNRGTVGGSLAHADAAAELPAVLLALDGSVIVHSRERGQRTIGARELFRGPFTTSLEADEMITEVFFPDWSGPCRWSFHEFARRSGDYAIAGVAVVMSRAPDGQVDAASVVLFGVAGTPIRAGLAEQALLETGSASSAAASVRDEVRPMGNVHGSAEYRRHLASVLTQRAVEEVLAWPEGTSRYP
jgi:carbon-monoxide dehydrogenase medium subunit